MSTVLGIIAVLIYFLAGAFIESISEEAFGYDETSAVCIIFWPLVVVLFIFLVCFICLEKLAERSAIG